MDEMAPVQADAVKYGLHKVMDYWKHYTKPKSSRFLRSSFVYNTPIAFAFLNEHSFTTPSSTMLQSSEAMLNDLFEGYEEQGFLSEGLPLARLTNPYYNDWEDISDQLPDLIQTNQIREKIDLLPICSTKYLQTEPEWRRACVIMGYLAHAYIWGGETPKDVSIHAILSLYE
jgi:hypothetical protein